MTNKTNRINIVLCAIIRQENKFLLVRDIKKPYWSFPQGKLDKAENLTSGIKREVFEETNLHFTPKSIATPIVSREHSEKGIRSLKFFFEGTWTGTPKAKNEIEEVKFFSQKEIQNLRLKTPEIRKFLNSIAENNTLPLSTIYTFQTDKK